MISSKITNSELTIILDRLKVSKNTFNRAIFLHGLLGKMPNQNDLRLYRYVLGDEVITHSAMLGALDTDTDLINKSLSYPSEINCLVNGDWIMQRTGLDPGIKLGRLKDWLFRIQIERGYDNIEQLETALCTIPWQSGDPKLWPRPEWP